MSEVGGSGVLGAPNIAEAVGSGKGRVKSCIPDETGVVSRGEAEGIDAVLGGLNAVEVTNNEEGPSGRWEEGEDGGGVEDKPLSRLSRGVHGQDSGGERVEEEVEAQDATIGEEVCSASGGEKVDVGEVGGGTEDDEDATRGAGARRVKKPDTRPKRARAWLPPKEVLRTLGGLRLCHNYAVKMLFAHPGD